MKKRVQKLWEWKRVKEREGEGLIGVWKWSNGQIDRWILMNLRRWSILAEIRPLSIGTGWYWSNSDCFAHYAGCITWYNPPIYIPPDRGQFMSQYSIGLVCTAHTVSYHFKLYINPWFKLHFEFIILNFIVYSFTI